MPWNFKKKLNKNGSQRLSAIQYCNECEYIDKKTKVDVLFKVSNDPETWFFMECDTCSEPVCENCSDLDEENGERECGTCYQNQKYQKGN